LLSVVAMDAAARSPTPTEGQLRDPVWVGSGRYELKELLGGGATSRVYAAHDHLQAREVAVKIALAHGPAPYRERIVHEGRLLRAVRHPALVEMIDGGLLDETRPYLVMRRVYGQPLSDVLRARGGRFAWQEAIPILIEVLDALGAVHGAGIVHRDVKPANVMMIRHDRVVVVDLGFALGAQAGPRLTPDGRVVGTPGFIAPEVLSGASDARPSADVYGVGVMAFLLLAGRMPYRGELAEILQQVFHGPPPDLAREVPELPSPLAAIVARAMARDASDRYRDAGLTARALREALAGLAAGEL
jgi:serine/threonine-protein kinase